MDLTPRNYTIEALKNSSRNAVITLANPSDDPLHNVHVTFEDLDPNDNVTPVLLGNVPNVLEAGASIPLTVAATFPENAPR